MGDAIEDIVAEPDEPSPFAKLLSFVQFQYVASVIASNGWYLLIAGAVAYYVWKKHVPTTKCSSNSNINLSPQEIRAFESKEEARRRYVEQLQEKYNQESAIKAEKDKIREDEKRKARLEEVERLANAGNGQKLGTTHGPRPSQQSNTSGTTSPAKKPTNTPSLRPEYNPLMGDTSGSSRSCSRPSGGRAGG